MAEFKENTIPKMLGVLQKHVKDGHFIGSDGVSSVCMCVWYMFHCPYCVLSFI